MICLNSYIIDLFKIVEHFRTLLDKRHHEEWGQCQWVNGGKLRPQGLLDHQCTTWPHGIGRLTQQSHRLDEQWKGICHQRCRRVPRNHPTQIFQASQHQQLHQTIEHVWVSQIPQRTHQEHLQSSFLPQRQTVRHLIGLENTSPASEGKSRTRIMRPRGKVTKYKKNPHKPNKYSKSQQQRKNNPQVEILSPWYSNRVQNLLRRKVSLHWRP